VLCRLLCRSGQEWAGEGVVARHPAPAPASAPAPGPAPSHAPAPARAHHPALPSGSHVQRTVGGGAALGEDSSRDVACRERAEQRVALWLSCGAGQGREAGLEGRGEGQGEG